MYVNIDFTDLHVNSNKGRKQKPTLHPQSANTTIPGQKKYDLKMLTLFFGGGNIKINNRDQQQHGLYVQ